MPYSFSTVEECNPLCGGVAICVRCECEIDSATDQYYRDTCTCCYRCTDCGPHDFGNDELLGPSFNQRMERRSRRVELIHSYSYKPRPYSPKGNYPEEVLMGIELEMGGSDKYEIAQKVKDIDTNEDHLYCKSDCSIYGAEIVTHPMTLAWAKEYQFDTLLEKLRDIDSFTDSEECGNRGCGSHYCDHEYGLHIHVSRNAFRQARKSARGGPESIAPNESYEQRIGRQMREMRRREREQQAITHQMIWLMFLERNSDKLSGELNLCRRDPSHYAAFKKSELSELRQKASNQAYFDEGRYMAINCQNDKTYELRFFKATLDSQEFWAALEFADASVEYTRGLDANVVLRNGGLKWSEFVKWLGERNYPNLSAELVKLGITE